MFPLAESGQDANAADKISATSLQHFHTKDYSYGC
jgi:hypothetical protein